MRIENRISLKGINWILVLIIIVGAILRFVGFPHIPFTYDELSAWGRTDYNSFSDLINKGVRGDGHPALIQVFLFYWRKIAGDSEAAFKLPFLLMGLASIRLLFLIGRRWFNETVGIICASLIAVLQYTVLYSQVARPYISGLFFSLALVNEWSKYVLVPDAERKRKTLIWFVLLASLCCYNHYFSMLFAFIVGISGFFFLPLRRWVDYLVAGILVVLLFLPHVGITLDQFAIGGVGGWLAKPTPQFFTDFLYYIFEFSDTLVIVVAIAVLLGLIFINKEWRRNIRFQVLSLCWFVAPLLIGYVYSVQRNPVLQYSVLIFSFPYLLLFLFSFFRNVSRIEQLALSVSLMAAGIFSLVVVRQHYDIFYRQPVQQMVQHVVDFEKAHPGKKCLAIIQEPEKYMRYYLDKRNSKVQIFSWEDLNIQSYCEAQKFLNDHPADYALCGNVPYDYLQVIRNSYPKLIGLDKGFTYEYYERATAMASDSAHSDMVFGDTLHFTSPSKFWALDNFNNLLTDSATGVVYFHFDSAHEFGPTFSAWLYDMMRQRNEIVLVDFSVKNVPPHCSASLVLNFDQQGNTIFYSEKPISLFLDSTQSAGHLVTAFRIRDYEFSRTNPKMKAYIWNKGHESFDLTGATIELQKGNPLIYSLIEPVPDPLAD